MMKDLLRWLILVKYERALKAMSPRGLVFFSALMGLIHYVLQRRQRRVIREGFVRDLEMKPFPRELAVLRSFSSHMMNEFELTHYPMIDGRFTGRYVTFHGSGWEYLQSHRGRSALLVTFHFGPNQIIIPCLPSLGFKFTQIGVPPSYWDNLVNGSDKFRAVTRRRTENLEATKAKFLYVSDGMASLRKIYDAVKHDEILCIACDGRFGKVAEHPFLKGSIDINPGAFRIAAKLELPLIPVFCMRDGTNYSVEMRGPHHVGEGNTDTIIRECVEGLEEYVSEHPEHYGWMYNAKAIGG